MGLVRKAVFFTFLAVAATALDRTATPLIDSSLTVPQRSMADAAKAAQAVCETAPGACGKAVLASFDAARDQMITSSIPVAAIPAPVLADVPLPPRRPKGLSRQTP